MQLDGYAIDILVQGYPGKTVCHGALGWSTVVLIRGKGRVALVDVGTFGMRQLIVRQLAERGLKPGDVTDVLLTHSHWDHSVNWTLFRHARIAIGADELAWSLEQPWGETAVPELYVKELAKWPTARTIRDGERLWDDVTAHIAPGHTPGCLVYVLHGRERDVIFTGDAAKNRPELITRAADMTYDAAVSRRSIETIWELWRRKPGSIVVPGHDLPMTQADGRITQLGRHEAAVTTWLGDDLETTTRFELTVKA